MCIVSQIVRSKRKKGAEREADRRCTGRGRGERMAAETNW